ncbi:unnamed protein product [Victoria cruziana]
MKHTADLPSHYLRARCFYIFCFCMAIFSLTAVVTFQLTAIDISQWFEYIWRTASSASSSQVQELNFQTIDGKVFQLCALKDELAGNRLDMAKLEAFCKRELLLIKVRNKLNDLDNVSLQRLASSQKILDPLMRGLSEGKDKDMMNMINQLQQRIGALGEMVKNSVTFLPLKDLRFQSKSEAGHTWFMSTFYQSIEDENGFLHFPSEESKQRILCVVGKEHTDGTKNGYGLAWRDYLPPNSTLIPGLTFVAESNYDYANLWHGLMALGPFVLWDGYKLPLDILDYGNGPVCFEKSLVNRHSFGSLPSDSRFKAFDVIRTKTRAYCNITNANKGDGIPAFNFTLLTRAGARSFRNESIAASIFETECKKVRGCHFRGIRANNLSFCDQVSLLSSTHVLVTVHGAQLTNVIFMQKGSHIMEIFPKGWLEFAGVGQYVFRWLADWAGMNHEGTWRDTEGPECSRPEKERLQCFSMYKNAQVGCNQTAFSRWSRDVLKKASSSISAATRTT